MKKAIAAALLICAAMILNPAAYAGDTLLGDTALAGEIDKAAKATAIDGEIGLQFRLEDLEVADALGENDAGAGWTYAELEVETGSIRGAQIGTGMVAVQRLWTTGQWDNGIPGDEVFEDSVFFDKHDAFWTELYLKYTIPGKKTYFILGRADDGKFGDPVSGDGDFYQGIGVTVKDFPGLKIRAHAVNAWTNNASASWDFDGIQTDWESLSDEDAFATVVGRDASDWAYTLMVGVDVVKEKLSITPYIQHQGKVGTAYGMELEAKHKVNSSTSVGAEGAYAKISEDTPNDLWPDDADVSQWIINPYVKYSVNRWKLRFGGGYYTISNDIAPFNTLAEGGDDFQDLFIWNEFDPMKEDIAKYGEQQNNKTYFLEAGAGYGPVELKVIYGWVDNAAVEDGWLYRGEGSELDVYLSLDITKSIDLNLIYCDVDDDFQGPTDIAGRTDPFRSFSHISGRLRYKF